MRIALFLCLSLFFFSCKKERTIHITAKNAVTGAPYEGLTYYVVQEKTGGYGGEKFKTVASGTLDANGEAYFTKKLTKDYSYAVRVEQPANTCYNKQITYYFGDEGVFEAPFEFAECAYLKQNITNVNCQGTSDYMILKTSNQVNSIGATGWEFFGCNGYVGDHFSEVPFGKYYFEWEVTRNNITNTYYDTIYLSPGEYKTYDINY